MSRKKLVAIRCDGDGCGKMAEIENESVMPVGWLTIQLPDDGGRLAPERRFDLCSLRCVQRWAKARAQITGEISTNTSQASYIKSPCPICEIPIAPQGLRQHVSVQHPEEDYETVKALYNDAKAEAA